MSIKGIDAQIMVTRTAEASKDISAELRKGELFQNQIAVQGRSQDEQETRMVVRTEQAEQAEIRQRENERVKNERRQQRDRRKGDRRGSRGERAPSDGELPAGYAAEHKIDIKV